MLKINIIAIGKNKDTWVAESVMHYTKYIRRYANISIEYLPDKSRSRSMAASEVMKAEAELIKRKPKSNYLISLSDRGKSMDSLQFSEWLKKLSIKCGGACDFIIGGIYGLDKDILSSSNEIISLSPLTMSHQLVRPVLLEQIYRAFSIINGGKYHK